ncbi:MAG: DUF5615 family PIN-like protein [bacterium]
MKLLIDMNLSPLWIEIFRQHGIQSIHWSTIGDPCAVDSIIMNWALENGYVVFTHDLDFGALLSNTRTKGPSIIQVRTQDIMPEHLSEKLINVIKQYESLLESGSIITIDENKCRVRILPF